MHHHSHNADDPDSGSAPAALQAALVGLYRDRVAIPREVDEAVLKAARMHGALSGSVARGLSLESHGENPRRVETAQGQVPAREQLRTEPGTWRQALRALAEAGRQVRAWFQRPPLRWGTATVLAVLAIGLATLRLPHRTPALVADFNRDGVVDVRDALALARAAEAGALLTAQFDLNGDGVIDRADADRVAALAVSLDGRGPL
jgi:hypothetical protein